MHALKLTLTRIGSQLAIAVPPDMLARHGLKEGDTVYLSFSDTGRDDGAALAAAVEASFSADPATVEQLRAGHEFMRDFHAAFRALAR